MHGTVTLVDVETLRPRGTIHAMRGFAGGVAFSPDNRLLAVCGNSPRVSLWDARTLTRVGDLTGLESGPCQSVVFSPNGGLIAASAQSDPGRLRVWDVATRTLTPYRSATQSASIAFSRRGDQLATATGVGPAEIRDARTGRLVARLASDADSRSVAFSPDGKVVVVGQYDGRAMFYSTANWRRIAPPLRAHNARITYEAFSPDGRTLATANAEGTVALWDVASQKPLGAPLRFAPASFTAAAFGGGGRYLFAISTRGAGVRFDMSPADWERHACLIAGHDLSRSEWADAVPGRAYDPVCAG
jgi:WD40 repeat protein